MDEDMLRSAGIAYDTALARFVGKHEIYEKYLVKFLEDSFVEDAIKAYENKDIDIVLEQTHALKGVAGTLGITALYEMSAQIVSDLRKGDQDNLKQKLEQLLEESRRIKQVIEIA